jgi:xylulokinase
MSRSSAGHDAVVIGIDASTTACKAIAFDGAGRALAEGRAPIALDNPAPDAWQQDAEQWWQALCVACRELMAQLDGRQPLAACITQQRETFVLTDDDGTPLHPALVWMDARCGADVTRAVEAIGEAELHRLSGKPPCTTPSFYKLLFLLRDQPALAQRDPRMLDVHALLSWRLTGRCATSLASADPSGMIDMAARRWAEPLVTFAGLDPDRLPELLEPGELLGKVSRNAAAASGLPEGLPLVAGAGDGQCAGLGAGLVRPGRAYLNLGTAVVSGVLSERYQTHRTFRTLYGGAAGSYFLETDLQGGTFTVSWLLERLLGVARDDVDDRLAELSEQAAALPPGADGLVLLPYWNGVMNPFWDADASGMVLGLRGSHGPAHLYRAVLEGIALEQRLHTSGVEQATGPIEQLVVMGGGSRSDLWCQIIADVTGKAVARSASAEATALGAAMLAAVHAGVHPDLEAASHAMTGLGEAFAAGEHAASYDRLYRQVYLGLYERLADAMKQLARLRRNL